METESNFKPAPVPNGITTVGDRQYMSDPRGALVPLSVVKPAEKLQDETVRKIMGYALALSSQLERFKAHTMADLTSLDQLLEQQYGLVRKGNVGKGNRTYLTFDGLFRVTVQVADYVAFGPELQVAKTLIDQCLTEWSADSRPEIQAIVTRAFNTDKEGKINRSNIYMLFKFEISDERWQRAMAAIRDAIRVIGRKEYVRFGMRSDPGAEWTSVTIDLAQA